jgi:protein TonB
MKVFGDKSVTIWTLAGIMSVLFNIILFGFMPALVSDTSLKKTTIENYHQVNMVRIKDVKPEPEKIKEKIEPKKEIMSVKKPLYYHKIKVNRLNLDINPKLTQGAGALVSPEMVKFNFSDLGIKDIFDLAEVDAAPMPVAQMQPLYPLRAKRAGIEGWVKVRFVVNTKGLVEKVRVIEAMPENIFDQSVIKCLSSWRFSPGTYEGEPVNTLVGTMIRFELE